MAADRQLRLQPGPAGDDLSTVLRRADLAMFRAKRTRAVRA